MKKILLLLLFFIFIPIVNADKCKSYQCIECSYRVENYNIVFKAKSSGVEGKGQVKFSKEKYDGLENTKKSTFSKVVASNSLKQYNVFINEEANALQCPGNIYGYIKNNTLYLNYKKTSKYKNKINLINQNDNNNPYAKEKTDWGKIEDTNLETICSKPELRKPLKFIGTLITVLKVAIPILIIVFGIIDLFKAISSAKDDRIFTAAKSIGIRFIAGVFIFFIPGIIQLILDWVNEWSNYQNTWCCCTQCILDSSKCDVNSCSSDSCNIGGMN